MRYLANKQDYIRYITLLNYNDATGEDEGYDFFWKDWQVSDYGGITPTSDYDEIPSNWSWLVPYSSRVSSGNSLVGGSYYLNGGMLCGKLTATITTSNNGAHLLLNTRDKTACGCLPNYSFFTFKADETNGLYTSTALRVNEYTFWHSWIWCVPSSADYGDDYATLDACFEWLIANVRNINIIVDDEDWTERTPDYTWQSVAGVSGQNGVLNFTTLKDDSLIGDGDTNVAVNSNQINFNSASSLQMLLNNVPDGREVTVQWAGNVDRLTLKHTDVGGYYIKIYNNGAIAAQYSAQFVNEQDDQLSYLGFIIDEENEVAKAVVYQPYDVAEPKNMFMPLAASDEEMNEIYLFLHGHYNPDEDNPEVIEEDPDGEGTHWIDTEIEGLSKPTKSAINTGFTSMFMVTETNLQDLARFMWSSDFLPNIQKFYSDPREIIIGLSIMPCIPDVEENPSLIYAGGISTGIYGYRLADQYLLLDDFASIDILEDKDIKFLNYSPYTRITAHLPFVGEHSLDVNDVMGHKLTLSYLIDFLTGSCVAEIKKDGKPRYFFGGSCGMQIPTSAEDFSRTFSSLLSAGASIGSALATIATGGLTAPLALGTAANMLSNGLNMSPTVQFSSGSGGTNSMLSSQTAFLKVETPNEKVSDKQAHYVGRQSLIRKRVGACSGYTKFLSIHLDGIVCTSDEKQMIMSYMTGGFRRESHENDMPDLTPTTETDHVIVLMKCSSENDVLGKAWTDAVKVEGKLMFSQDLTSPVFTVEGAYYNYNYAYVPEFERYYFINKPKIESGNIVTLPMNVDVLESFKDDIEDRYGILDRQEFSYNSYMTDSMIWTQANQKVDIVPFLDEDRAEAVFPRLNNRYILTIAGGA